MISDYFRLSFRNLKKRGLRSWLTLLGIFIGIAAVVALISLGNGLRVAVSSQFGVSSTEVISVQAGGLSAFGPPGSAVADPLTRQDVEAIEKLSTVEYAIPRNLETVKVQFKDIEVISSAISMPNDREQLKQVHEILDISADQGNLLQDSDTAAVVLGYDFSLKDKSGFDRAIGFGDTIEINSKKFKVKGITERKGSFIFDKIIYMTDDALEALTGYGDDVDVIAVKVKNKDLLEKSQLQIEDLLRERRNVDEGEENFEVSTPQQSLATVDQILAGVQIFIVFIALISIIVGAIGIVNTMTTSVLERTKEIGIMKAIGAKNSDIFLQFLIESGLLGLIGGLAGSALGVLVGYFGVLAINSFLGAATVPEVSILLVSMALIGSFLIGAISGVTPALKAAKLNPVDALRS